MDNWTLQSEIYNMTGGQARLAMSNNKPAWYPVCTGFSIDKRHHQLHLTLKNTRYLIVGIPGVAPRPRYLEFKTVDLRALAPAMVAYSLDM